MGYDAEKGFVSSGIDPSWLSFLNQLEKHGVDRKDIEDNMDFIKNFVREAQDRTVPTNPSAGGKANERLFKKDASAVEMIRTVQGKNRRVRALVPFCVKRVRRATHGGIATINRISMNESYIN